MSGRLTYIFAWVLLVCCAPVLAQDSTETDQQPSSTQEAANQKSTNQEATNQTKVDNLSEPLYNPFVERYVLDELKQLRMDMAAQKHELMQQILDREHHSIDRGVTYATNTVTYFFYLIAGATSVLVLVGWSSLREIKERIHTVADQEISKLVSEYETRLRSIEGQLSQKTSDIEENREEIELTREIQSLWLRAQQDSGATNKIVIYDQILKLNGNDCEALTYKADAVLELGEPQWAANLCHQALLIDNNNGHAFYQLGCAYAAMHQPEEAVKFLRNALDVSDAYRQAMADDPALSDLHGNQAFNQLISA